MLTSERDWMSSPDGRVLRFEDIEPYLKDVKCVGFDIFDTLLLRPFMRPEDLFSYLEGKESSPGFCKERVKAERNARKIICNEICLDEIYSLMDERFSYLKEKEIDAECKLIVSDPDMKLLYDRVAALGIDIVLVSDMYLPKGVISKMLENCGYEGYRDIYVSNAYRKNKHSGELFGIVLDELDLQPDEMLFIGDNQRSDYKVPLSLGIRSVKYTSAKERYAKTHRREMRFCRRRKCVGSSIIVSMDMLSWLRSPNVNEDDYWYDLGYRFGGPVASFFTLFLMSNVSDVKSILFISRDGYNLQKVYGILCEDPIDNHYVYASRLFTMVFGNDVTESKDGAMSLFKHFSDVDEVKAIDIPDDASKNDLVRYLKENRELFKGLLKDEAARYRQYLMEKVGDDGDVVVVDVTTKKYSSQKFIQNVLGSNRRVIGCYYNLLGHGDLKYSVYADRSVGMFNWNAVNVPEFFLGSPEPPVSDMTADGVPIFPDDVPDAEKFRMSIYDRITQGELDYARDLKTMFGDEMPLIGSEVLDRWMKVLVKDRSSADPEHLSKIRWAPDPMHTRYLSLVFTVKEIPYLLENMAKDLVWRLRSK